MENVLTLACTLIYLSYGGLAGLYFFTAARNPELFNTVSVLIPIAIAMHIVLQQRRVRRLLSDFSEVTQGSSVIKTRHELWTNGTILAFLVIFDLFASVVYVDASWVPLPGFVPAIVQILMRACIPTMGALFLGTITPLKVDTTAIALKDTLDNSIFVLAQYKEQFRRSVEELLSSNINLAPVATQVFRTLNRHEDAALIASMQQGITDAREQVAASSVKAVVTYDNDESPYGAYLSDKIMDMTAPPPASHPLSTGRTREDKEQLFEEFKALLATDPEHSMDGLCERFGISKTTVRNWKKRMVGISDLSLA